MQPAPCAPRNGLHFTGLDAHFFCGIHVGLLNLATQLNSNVGDAVQRDPVASPDTVGMAIDANVLIVAQNADEELFQLGAGQEGQSIVVGCLLIQDPDSLRFVLAERANLNRVGRFAID